ncbi:Minichromosome maintenance protein MCM [uncultured archaeon]|nr:Minichromosome maintenance protein MCM [uncultured archaeon]
MRFFQVPDNNILIENISSKNLGEMVSVKGVVNRRADVMHRMKIVVYKCQVCDSIYKIPVERDLVPMKRCESCKKIALKQMDDESHFVDLQKAEIQELLERVRGGTPAARMEIWIEDDIVNTLVPGDNVQITGILRLKPPNAQKGKQEMVYGRYIEVNYIYNLRRDFEEIEISSEEAARIVDFSKDPQLFTKITQSIAPSIYGHNEVKYAIALQIFGGTKGKMTKGLPIRDDIHLILIGDPGIAKSRFLQSVMDIAPKKIYVSGKSVSGVGLTVAVEKDELSGGGWTLKAGALVLASGGLAAIDEFDKIEDEDRASLHEVMESQTVSIAKAGLVATFRTKTAILAAANPKFGRFNQNKNLVEQFDIPPSLMSRFDLIFPILDVLDVEKDTKLAEYILNAHQQASMSQSEQTQDKELVAKDFFAQVHFLLTEAHIPQAHARRDGQAQGILHRLAQARQGLRDSADNPALPGGSYPPFGGECEDAPLPARGALGRGSSDKPDELRDAESDD